jgi:subtilisin family serine protease
MFLVLNSLIRTSVGVGTWVIGAKANPLPSAPVASSDFITFSGTSQATPGIAGAAGIIREYLQKGYYPSGAPNASAAVLNPSGALLKALLIASARPLDGYTLLWGR